MNAPKNKWKLQGPLNQRGLLIFLFGFVFFTSNAQTEKIVTSDGVSLHVTVKGSGRPCLYIHGGPGSGSYWLEQFVGEELEEQFQMVYLDQRGVGRSTSPKDNNYSMKRMILDFEEVRERLGIESWIILGHSFGGILQMGYVLNSPEVINGMIFINCTLSLADSFGTSWLPKAIELAGDDTPELCLNESVSLYERMLTIMAVLNEKGIMWKIFFVSEEDNHKMNETYADFDNWNNDFSEKAMEIQEYWKDFRPLTSNVKQPVLFFYGKADWAIGPRHYKNLAFPNMLLWESAVGHMPFLENRKDLLNAIDAYRVTYKL